MKMSGCLENSRSLVLESRGKESVEIALSLKDCYNDTD